MQLYTADSDKKLIFPIMFEEVDFDASESGQGVKFTTSGVNWTMCRPGVDDYDVSMTKLISAMRAKGQLYNRCPLVSGSLSWLCVSSKTGLGGGEGDSNIETKGV